MNHARRPRVLLIAELCNPSWVSVPLEGWSHSRALSRIADVHLVTAEFNRPNILDAGLREGIDFTVIESHAIRRTASRLAAVLRGRKDVGWTIATAFDSATYGWFERRLWRRLGPRLAGGDFDVVHRLTPLTPTAPSSVARRCRQAGVPFVLGPLNGGLPWPEGFRGARRGEREWLTPFRAAHRLLPGYRATRENASAIIVGSRATRAQMAGRWTDRCVYIPENGFDPGRFSRRVEGEARLPLRVAFVGRHVRYKGADLLVEAAAPLVRAGAVRLDIIGEGPETPRLRSMAEAAGLSAEVEFPGWVGHRELQDRLIRADILGFPSVREFGGAVVVEAMALGLLPVVLDYGGPGEIVTSSTGIAVPMGSRPQVVESLRSALSRLAGQAGSVRTMGERARRRAHRLFTWDAKAAQVLEVYRWVCGESPAKPDFGMPLAD